MSGGESRQRKQGMFDLQRQLRIGYCSVIAYFGPDHFTHFAVAKNR